MVSVTHHSRTRRRRRTSARKDPDKLETEVALQRLGFADDPPRLTEWRMDSAREYRQHAAACLRLAHESTEFYVKLALTELAGEFSDKASTIEIEQRGQQRRAGERNADRLRGGTLNVVLKPPPS